METKRYLFEAVDVDGDGLAANNYLGLFEADDIKKVYRYLRDTYAPDVALAEIPHLYQVEKIEPTRL